MSVLVLISCLLRRNRCDRRYEPTTDRGPAALSLKFQRWGASPIEAGSIDAKLGINPVRHVYIIRNGCHDPEFKVVKATVWP
jgi:hypothetical protein